LKELIPGEFRTASHQGLELAFQGALEQFEDAVGNGFLQYHLDSSLSCCALFVKSAQSDIGVGTTETGESIALGRTGKREG
jgi:hypothetical protein